MKSSLFLFAVVGLFGCSNFDIALRGDDTASLPPYCENAQFVASESIMPKSKDLEAARRAGIDSRVGMTFASALKLAKNLHGDDVTIANLRYDVKNGRQLKQYAVTFDVIRCN